MELVSAFYSGLCQILVLETLELMIVGIMIGFAIGILPGLGGFTALALMLPFVVKMDAVQAFAFLLGMSAVVNTTGDITSILLGVPGEPTTMATIFDGHPMAKKGQAGRALGAAILSSLVGAIFGAFVLAGCIPIIRPLVLALASPELFMLAIVGITFIASLSGESLLKGIIAGGVGLVLSTVGICDISGLERYTFGALFLWDGIGIVGIALGFFAIPEITDLAVKQTSIARVQVGKLGGVMEGVKDTFRHLGLVIRCSALGAFISIIPGFGAGVSQFLAYGHALQSAKNAKERAGFGKGDVRGVLGPGAANNSALGGVLLTTIAFGIPPTVSMAILLGAFLIQGIVPGPEMLIPESSGGHLSLSFSFVWINVVANMITVGICFLVLNQLVKVTRIRSSLMIPLIISLVYLGTFAEKNSFQDLYLMLIFGGFGWAMIRFNWPRPPLVLGLVLGSMAESRFYLTIDNYGLSWLLRPGVLIIILVLLIGIFYPALRTRRQRAKTGKNELSMRKATNHDRTKSLSFSWETVFSLGILGFLIFTLWTSRHFDFRTGLFPWVIEFSVLPFAIAQLAKDFRGKGEGRSFEYSALEESNLPSAVMNRRTASIFGWIIVYFIGIWLFGFSVGLPLCTFLHLKIGGREKWPIALILSALTWTLIYCLFNLVMHIPFPTGKLWLF